MTERQTGRTTAQMLLAPRGACFVWCNSELGYPKSLAAYLRRRDLTIISPQQDTDHYHTGRGWMIVRDHACTH